MLPRKELNKPAEKKAGKLSPMKTSEEQGGESGEKLDTE